MARKRQEEREAEERAKAEEVKAAAEAKKSADLAYKASIRDLIKLLGETLVSGNFDRFWVEGQQRKLLQTREKVEMFIQRLQEIKASGDASEIQSKFERFVADQSQSDAERAAAAQAEAEEEKKTAPTEDSNWTKEEIKLLTGAIVKFPPGTTRRW